MTELLNDFINFRLWRYTILLPTNLHNHFLHSFFINIKKYISRFFLNWGKKKFESVFCSFCKISFFYCCQFTNHCDCYTFIYYVNICALNAYYHLQTKPPLSMQLTFFRRRRTPVAKPLCFITIKNVYITSRGVISL